MSKIDVSVIIVNYNTKDLTNQCIDSIFDKTKDVCFEVIVVDNASTDGSIELLKNDNRIVYIGSGLNLGFGKANNLGVKYSKGRYLFFLNSDTILINNAIKEFFDFMESKGNNLNIGAVGCLLVDSNYNRIHSYGNFPTMSRTIKNEWIDHVLKRFGKRAKRFDEGLIEPKDVLFFQVGYITGADLFCKREVFIDSKGFDPDFFMYWEETEMQYRWKKRYGLSAYILKGPKIIHLEGKSNKTPSQISSIKKMQSMFMYFKKTSPKLMYYLFRCIIFIGRIHLFLLPKLNNEEKKILFKTIIKKY